MDSTDEAQSSPQIIHNRNEMSPSVYLWIVASLNLQTYVKSPGPCGESNVSGAVRGAVTLHLTVTGNRIVVWNFGNAGIIAVATPSGTLRIQHIQYEGRLRSSSDGSLTITNLQQEDQGTYRARSHSQRCFYHLSVFNNLTTEDLTISSNVTNNKTCEVILTCSVTAAKRSHVTFTWRSLNSSIISQTYSLTVPPNATTFTYICTANNPVSGASKSVILWENCQRGEITPIADYTTVNVTRLVISGCVLMIGCCIFIHHMKTEVIGQRPGTGGT